MAQLSLNRNERIEITILSNLLSNEEFTRKAIPFIKEDYFSNRQEKILFTEIFCFILQNIILKI